MPKTLLAKLVWQASILGASAIGGIAIHRGESINAIWFVAAAICTSGCVSLQCMDCAKVLVRDETRATPAEIQQRPRFVPTNK